MYTKWTQHLTDPEEIKRFQNEIQSSRHVLEHLKQMLDQEEKVLNRQEMDVTAYEKASWPYYQSDQIGQRKMLNKIRKLIDLDQQKE